MPVNMQSRYPLGPVPKPKAKTHYRTLTVLALLAVIAGTGIYSLPSVVILQAQSTQSHDAKVAILPQTTLSNAFPVSVNPSTKSIINNPHADEVFKQNSDSLTASVGSLSVLINWVAAIIDQSSLYQSLASVNSRLITVNAGDRREQILARLASTLHWTTAQQKEFLTAADTQTPGLSEGIYAPGTYAVDASMTPTNVASLMGLRFNQSVLSHYGTTTAAIIPLSQALTVASLIQKETGGPEDMRQISGIIWNRLFNNMNLQIDATLQYAKGQNTKGTWWGTVVPKDKYVKSAYNTYQHAGLPPGPIAEPSVAAVLAALNPVQTSCIFYFHDKYGNFHCSDTYAQHVALLKKYYGQGK